MRGSSLEPLLLRRFYEDYPRLFSIYFSLMAFMLKEDTRVSFGGGTLDVTVINDEATASTLGAESTYGISLSQIQGSTSSNIPDAIVSIVKDIRNLGE